MAKLKSWYDVVDLRDDLTKGRPLDASEFAVHLDHIRDGRAHEDYRDPSRFFERTYADWAVDHSNALVGVQSDTAYQLFESSYPFHPSVLSVFERKWSSLPQFQRTRGILRLLALWVARVYQDDHLKSRDEPLITLGSAPLEDQTFRDDDLL